MSDKLGLRIVARIERPPRESFAGLLKVTTDACDAMDRGGAMDWRSSRSTPRASASARPSR